MNIKKYVNEEVSKYMLKEVALTSHFIDRYEERVNNIDSIQFEFPEKFYEAEDDKVLINNIVIKLIKSELDKVINKFKRIKIGDDLDNINYGVWLGRVKVRRNNKDHNVFIILKNDNKTRKGNIYVASVYNNRAITLLLYEPLYTESMIIKDIERNVETKQNKEIDGVTFYKFNDFIIANLDEALKKPDLSVASIPKPKAYIHQLKKSSIKKGSTFTHPKLGRVEILGINKDVNLKNQKSKFVIVKAKIIDNGKIIEKLPIKLKD
ncbi:MAG: hypothetical protein ACOC33_01230 [bacterium]